MYKLTGITLMTCLLAVSFAFAQEDDLAAPPPIPPVDVKPPPDLDEDVPIPPKVQDEQITPEVRIRRDEKDNLIEEYSQGGRVYMVRVTPKVGLPYYYLDDDGDGTLELQERDAAANPVKPVYWKVTEWK